MSSEAEIATDRPTRPVPGTKSANMSFDSVSVSPGASARTVRRVRIWFAGRTSSA